MALSSDSDSVETANVVPHIGAFCYLAPRDGGVFVPQQEYLIGVSLSSLSKNYLPEYLFRSLWLQVAVSAVVKFLPHVQGPGL